jgi:hypothetical protein
MALSGEESAWIVWLKSLIVAKREPANLDLLAFKVFENRLKATPLFRI